MRRASFAAAALCLAATAVSAQTLNSRAAGALKEQPVRFEANRGQADPRVRYISRARDYTVALTDDEALLLVRRPTSSPQRRPLQASDMALVRMRLAGGAPTPRITAADSQPARVYLADTTGSLTPIDTFARVEYAGVYPGIDLVYYGDDHHLEFDFVVAPFADPNRIAFSLDGAQGLTLTDAGDLTMRVGGAEVRLEKPLVYQERDGNRIEIPGAYLLPADDTTLVRFQLGSYDRALPLVIDPAWMTVFGSTNEDWLSGFAVDSAGHPVVLGETFDPATFPFTHLEAGVLPAPSCFFSKFDTSSGLASYTILFRNTQQCGTLALAPNDVAFFTGFVFPNTFLNNQGTTVTVVDDRSGFPAVSRIPVANYDSSAVGEGVDALAVNGLNHLFLLGPCRQVGPGDPPLELNGYNETPNPQTGFSAEACTAPPAGLSEADQPLLTVIDITSGALLYASFLSPGELVTRYGLAADDADRAYIVGAQSSSISPTADAYRPSCLPAGTRGHDTCAYLMVLDTTTVGPASLVYASHLWNTENTETLVARLGPAGALIVASDGRVFDDFPNNRPTDPSSWPYSLYPALREGIQLARFTPDANGLPSQFDFATVFDPSLAVAALVGHPVVREALADLRLFPSGAPAVASIAYTQTLAPMGIVTTFPLDAERVGEVWTHNLGTRTPVGFGVATGSGGSLFLAGQIDRIGAQDTDLFVERIDATDPGANRPPTVFILERVTTLYAESPTGGALLQLNSIATDPDGDPLTYSWTGPFTDSPVTTDFFISSRLALGMQQTVTVTVDDGHGNVASASLTLDVVGTPFVGTTATPVDSTYNGLAFNYAPVTITATGIGGGGGSAYLRTRLDQNPPIPSHLQAGSPPIYLELSADAVLVPPIGVCIDTRGMSFASPQNVRLYHYQQSGPLGTWVDITAAGYPQGSQLCGQSDTLGTFAIFYPQVPSTAVQTIAGNGVLERSVDGPGGDPIDDYVDGPATSTPLNYLFGGAYDRANNQLFVSSGSHIMRLDLNTGTIARVAGNDAGVPGGIDGPGGDPRDDLVEGGNALTTYAGFPAEMVVSPAGDVVFFDRNTCRIRRLDVAQGRLFAVAGNGTCGAAGDGFGADQASLSYGPMAFDAAGNLFLADGTNARIRRIDALTNVIDTVAGDGTFGIPVNGAPARSTISLPMGIAFDSQGHLLIAGGMHLLRLSTGSQDALVDGDADEVITIVGGCNTNCLAPFNGDGLAISHPQVYLPGMGHLTVAQDGSVIFPDYFRIRRILPGADGVVTGASDEIISTIAGYYDWETVSEVTNFNGDTFSTQSLFSWARYVVDDLQGGIIVVDGNNHRVRRFGLPLVINSVVIQTASVPDAAEGSSYLATITAGGGTGSGYSWSISAGALPAGLTLAPAGTPSTTISGIPTEGGTFNFTVRVVDSDGTIGTRAFTLMVHSPVIVQTATVPDALEGSPYSTTITAAGGTGTYTWSISAGALPAGLTLAATGTPGSTLSGTPGEDGTFDFTVLVTDSSGGSGTRAFTLVVASSVIAIGVTETIVVTDDPVVLPAAMIDVTEQIAVTDAPGLLPAAMIDVTEQIAVTDVPGLLPSAMVEVVEQIVVADGPQVAPQAVLSLTLVPASGTHAVGAQATITALVSDGGDEATRVVLTTHAGPTVRVQFVDPGVANAPLSVTVIAGNPLGGSDVIVSLATSSSGAAASTAAQVAAALNASPAAASLLSAQTWPGNAGLGLARPRSLAALTPVHFIIEGAATSADTCLTGVPGLCSISYTRMTAGTDQVSAYLDVNGNGTSEAVEPTAFALSTWFDDVAPVLSLPASIVTEAQTPGGSVVTFSASATDNSQAPVNVVCSPQSGSLFPFNGSSPTTTSVTCIATDASGNPATGNFDVVVQDTTAPQVTPAQITIAATEATGARGNVPQAPHTPILQQVPLLAGAFDAGDANPTRVPVQWVDCSNHALVRGPVADTTLYPVGPNCFRYSFRDASGNVGTGIGTIEVSPPIGGHINVANVPVTATDLNNVPLPVKATFLALDQPGLLTAVPPPFVPPPPVGFVLVGAPLEIRSTALAPHAVVACMRPNLGEFAERLFLWESFQWVDRTNTIDPITGEICGHPGPVGTFALGRPDLPPISLALSQFSPTGSVEHGQVLEARAEDQSNPHSRVTFQAGVPLIVEFRDPLAPNFPLSVSPQYDQTGAFTGLAVSLATNATGQVISTAWEVTELLRREALFQPAYPGLGNVETWPGTTGAGIVAPSVQRLTAISIDRPASGGTAYRTYISVPGRIAIHVLANSGPRTESVIAYLDTDDDHVIDAGEPVTHTDIIWVGTEPPVLTLPGIITAQATSPAGASVNYTASAFDLIDGPIAPSCTPPSGATFPIGSTIVTCTATDAEGHQSTGFFTVTVVSPPMVLTVAPITATRPAGSPHPLTATLSDFSDESARVTVSVPDIAGMRVQFLDPGVSNSPLSVSVQGAGFAADIIVSLATNPSGALVSTAAQVAAAINASPAFTGVLAQTWPGNPGNGIVQPRPLTTLSRIEFVVDGPEPRTEVCYTTAPGTCSITYTTSVPATDTITVQRTGSTSVTAQVTWRETTPPVVTTNPAGAALPATSPAGAVVNYTASAVDNVDGPLPVSCSPLSGSTFPVGTTIVTCRAVDQAGNVGTGQLTVTVTPYTAPFVRLAATAAFTRNAAGQWIASITVTNNGNTTANAVLLTAAGLNSTGAPGLPVPFGPIAAGGQATRQLTFPGTAGATGPANVLRMTLTWTGGAVSVSQRATLP